MATSKIEFMVENITDKEALKKLLLQQTEISRVEIVGSNAVVLETTLSCDKATGILQNLSGTSAVVWGIGEGNAAVSIMEGNGIRGVVRFGGISKENTGLVDGTLHGLPPGQHSLQIHVAGDISDGCNSLGPILEPNGKLHTINVDEDGRTDFKFLTNQIKISEIIGRSLAVADLNNEKRYACGIIARSAGLFQNNKKICACDGITLWDEKYLPSVGLSRKQQFTDAIKDNLKFR